MGKKKSSKPDKRRERPEPKIKVLIHNDDGTEHEEWWTQERIDEAYLRSRVQQKRLTDDEILLCQWTYRKVGKYLHPTLEKWELGFMKDAHPRRELGYWAMAAFCLEDWCKANPSRATEQGKRQYICAFARVGVVDPKAIRDPVELALYNDAKARREDASNRADELIRRAIREAEEQMIRDRGAAAPVGTWFAIAQSDGGGLAVTHPDEDGDRLAFCFPHFEQAERWLSLMEKGSQARRGELKIIPVMPSEHEWLSESLSEAGVTHAVTGYDEPDEGEPADSIPGRVANISEVIDALRRAHEEAEEEAGDQGAQED